MEPPNHKLIGTSDSFLHVLDQASQLTQIDRPVLIVGERGTGKELIAERLHFLSERWAKPLIKMNCAAIQETLLESELFGHDAGAFTGAIRRHAGRFERARNGSLFLDELATLSLSAQEKLLRVIEYGEYERLGGSDTLKADVRLIAATNLDLPSHASQGKFRLDLLDRLAFDVITLPPLRERQEDIMLLAEHFAVKMSKELGREYFGGFTDQATDQLNGHLWPGNVRELKNVIERAVYRLVDPTEPVDTLAFDPFDSPYRPAATLSVPLDAKQAPKQDPQQEREPQPPSDEKPTPSLPLDFHRECRKNEKLLLEMAMSQAQFNQKAAAKLLGLSYHQLRNQLMKHQLLGR